MSNASAPALDQSAPEAQTAENTVLLKIENTYSDGHESTTTERLAPPASLDDEVLEEWWNEEVASLTGDGHGIQNPGLDATYTATVLAGPAELVGKTYDWG